MEIHGTEKRSVVLLPHTSHGHMTPMLQLGSVLHSKGFSIILAHSEHRAPDPSQHPHFLFLPLPDNLAGTDTSFRNTLNVILAINQNCKEPLLKMLSRMMNDEEQHGRISCIIYDALLNFGEEVAAHLQIPSMVFQTFSAACLQSYQTVLRLHEQNSLPLQESQLKDTVPELNFLRYEDFPVPVSSEIDVFKIHFTSINIRTAVAVVWNTAEELEHSTLARLQLHYKIPFFSLGPIHKLTQASPSTPLKEDTLCLAWLDKHPPNSVLYVSLGTVVSMDAKEVEEMAWGLANSNQPFLWVVRPLSVGSQKLEQILPVGFKEFMGERGLIVKWAPQKEVLAHPAVGGFLTHCGWNSTLESISEGVPTICRPSFGDQMINAAYLTRVWKIGLQVDSSTDKGLIGFQVDNSTDRSVIKKSIQKLMCENEGREMRERAVSMKQKLEASVQKDGSSQRSLDDFTAFISSFAKQT